LFIAIFQDPEQTVLGNWNAPNKHLSKWKVGGKGKEGIKIGPNVFTIVPLFAHLFFYRMGFCGSRIASLKGMYVCMCTVLNIYVMVCFPSFV